MNGIKPNDFFLNFEVTKEEFEIMIDRFEEEYLFSLEKYLDNKSLEKEYSDEDNEQSEMP